MSAGFLLPSEDSALIWRGPKKNGMILNLIYPTESETYEVFHKGFKTSYCFFNNLFYFLNVPMNLQGQKYGKER